MTGDAQAELPPVTRLRWPSSVRLVSAVYPLNRVFEDTVRPADLEVVIAVLAVTDPLAHAAAGDLALVEPAERVSGPGSSVVMAAFTHPGSSRFADSGVGAYYAARTLDTAIAETVFHQTRRLREATLGSVELVLNVYLAAIDARVHDVRGARKEFPDAYGPTPADYLASQTFAARLRAERSNGVAYDSLRDEGGECVALFRPRAVRLPVRHGGEVVYHWDGEAQRISAVERRIR